MFRRVAMLMLFGAIWAPGANARSFATRGVLEVPITARESVHRKISNKLTLRIDRSVDVHGIASWEVGVDDGHWLTQGNLLYHSTQWHGPYPTMIDAWMLRDHYFPTSNELVVRGYPWRVTVECRGCLVEGKGEASYLASGTIRVSWRRR